jgi:hypothetical protein
MPNLYFFSKLDSGYFSCHSLVREIFNSPVNKCFSMIKGDLILVASETLPDKNCYFNKLQLREVDKTVSIIKIDVHVAFDNRHREKKVMPKMYSNEVLDKVSKICGLIPTSNSNAFFIGPHKENKFNIQNTFRVFGEFKVENHNLLNLAIKNGIGSRKSYGFGLILAEGVK